MLTYRHNWGEDRVFYQTPDGRLRSMPASWTDVVASDPAVIIAAGRALFRVEDLLALAALLRSLRP